MKNNQGFTLIELLAVIVVLAIVMVLATTTVLPYMSEARESAFRIEATSVIESAESAVSLYNLGKVKLNDDATKSCKSASTMCFTIEELISLGIYEGEKDNYKGRVVITGINSNNPSYTLHLKKGTEFAIIGGSVKDYSNNTTDGGKLGAVADWSSDYEACLCS